MRRLYLQIYLAFLGIGAVALLTAALVSHLHFTPREPPLSRQLLGAAALLAEHVPPGLPRAEQHARLEALAARLQARIVLWDSSGDSIATAGVDPPPPFPDDPDALWQRHDASTIIYLRAPDGRRIGVVLVDRLGSPFSHFAVVLAILALTIGLLCYPLARRITRRLEQLQRGVEGLGAGDLRSRVAVAGRDEIAGLAGQFNRAAGRIEALVDGQRRMLASASHELRSPLARVRMALELVADASPEQQAIVRAAVRDIEELDALVGDLLLASRLEARPPRAHGELAPVDLAALAADEAARAGANDMSSGSAIVRGDAAALRRMIRNLLDNARRHGRPPIDLVLTAAGDRWRLAVEDCGPGVAEPERERIFEAFYRPAGYREGEGGVGLGLALVRQIAEHHGGTAFCEARPAGGSRFVVLVPRADGAAM